jgi:hypothetical protein
MACHNHLARVLRLNREGDERDAWSVAVEGSNATKVGLETKYHYDRLRVVCLTDGFSEIQRDQHAKDVRDMGPRYVQSDQT